MAPSFRPLVCSLLRDGLSYAELRGRHGVKASPRNGKVSLAYSQIDARQDDPVACQCRGLVLREGTWEVLARPFDRFFNLGESACAQIDWQTACFEEKLDGSLLVVYHADGRWWAATRQGCEAQGECQPGLTFAQLADAACTAHGVGSIDALMRRLCWDKSLTFMFELTAPHNRILVSYDRPSLTLLGVRDRNTGEEFLPVGFASTLMVPTPHLYRANNLAEVQALIANWSPSEHEGVVAKDSRFRRVKVKAPAYLAAHRMSDSISASWRAVVECIQTGKADEIGAMLSEYHRGRIARMRSAIDDLVNRTDTDLGELKYAADMKSFALAAKGRAWSAALFAVRRGNVPSVRDFAMRARPDHILDMVGPMPEALGGEQ